MQVQKPFGATTLYPIQHARTAKANLNSRPQSLFLRFGATYTPEQFLKTFPILQKWGQEQISQQLQGTPFKTVKALVTYLMRSHDAATETGVLHLIQECNKNPAELKQLKTFLQAGLDQGKIRLVFAKDWTQEKVLNCLKALRWLARTEGHYIGDFVVKHNGVCPVAETDTVVKDGIRLVPQSVLNWITETTRYWDGVKAKRKEYLNWYKPIKEKDIAKKTGKEALEELQKLNEQTYKVNTGQYDEENFYNLVLEKYLNLRSPAGRVDYSLQDEAISQIITTENLQVWPKDTNSWNFRYPKAYWPKDQKISEKPLFRISIDAQGDAKLIKILDDFAIQQKAYYKTPCVADEWTCRPDSVTIYCHQPIATEALKALAEKVQPFIRTGPSKMTTTERMVGELVAPGVSIGRREPSMEDRKILIQFLNRFDPDLASAIDRFLVTNDYPKKDKVAGSFGQWVAIKDLIKELTGIDYEWQKIGRENIVMNVNGTPWNGQPLIRR